jgi:hypothetical protein
MRASMSSRTGVASVEPSSTKIASYPPGALDDTAHIHEDG